MYLLFYVRPSGSAGKTEGKNLMNFMEFRMSGKQFISSTFLCKMHVKLYRIRKTFAPLHTDSARDHGIGRHSFGPAILFTDDFKY